MARQIKQQIKILAAVALLGVNLFAQYPQGYPQQPPPGYGQQGFPQQQAGYAPQGQGDPNAGPYLAQQYPPPGYRQPPNYGPPQAAEENPDDPARGAARLSLLQGEVNVRRGDSGELVAAALNAPLMSQDRVIAGPGSFAEVQFDAANMIRLAPGTDVGLAGVEYQKYQIQLGRGTIMYSIVRESRAQTEIDTPSVAIRPLRFGEYRISVLDDGTTQVTVRAGEAEVLGPQGSERFPEGRTMLIRSGPQGPEFQTSWAIPPDEFDQWNVTRDQQLQSSQSYRYVAADMAGAEDLDQYGRWMPSEYGQAWVPSDVPADWAPYRDGQWTWQDYYGWTWVDSAPWGWAPFHYGRWFQMGASHAWAWAPLALRGAANLWRPALVGFFGFGGIAGAAVLAASALGSLFSLFGNLGWSPLAPNEPFHAWYGPGYYNSYNHGGFGAGNIVRGANVAGMFRNARFGNGVSYASSANFGVGPQHFLAAGASQLTQAGLVRGPLPLAPTRQSLAFSGHGAYANAMPAARGAFFSRMQGAAVSRVPFATQSNALQQFSQRTLGTTFNRSYTPSPGAGTQAFTRNAPGGGWPQAQTRGYSSSPRSPDSNSSGWHSFGQTNGYARGNATAPQGYSGTNGSSNGWHVFGQPHQSSEAGGYRSGYGSYGSGYAAPQGSARGYYGGGYAGGNGQPLHLNQPMVQPRGYSPNYGGSRNYSAPPAQHYNYSAPKYSAPKYSAPKYKAPKSSGGSHGGGGHAKGGGGHHK
jgi:hypothetical protein